MKPTLIAVLCLPLLVIHINPSLAAKRGKFPQIMNVFKKPSKTKPNLDTKSKTQQPTQFNQGGYPQQPSRPGGYPNTGGYPQQPGRPGGYPYQGGYPQQPSRPGGYPYQGGYPQQPGRPGGYPYQGGYPQQPGRPGGYPYQGGYPQQPSRPGGYPYQGGYPQQPGRPGGYPYQSGYPNQGFYPGYPGHQAGAYPAPGYPYRGSYGGYPGGYINNNPNNKILSPHYAGSFGYGGYGAGGGSPFSNYAKAQGFVPSDKSKGFGRRAAMAAAGGALTGMALGYGLGRFPRPHFDFHSPREEYYYNYYMYRKYGIRSTDTNDFSRDYEYIRDDVTFDSFMKSCMNRADLLPVKNRKPNLKPAATTSKPPTAATVNSTTASITAALGTASSATSNSTATKNSSTDSPSTPHPLNKSEVNPAPAASQLLQTDDDDTVSIVEIGYPALITQVKLKRCIELYIVNDERNLKKKTKLKSSSGAQRLETDVRELFSIITSIIVILQTQLH
ncbi:calcium-binding protein P-like [Oreochromis aureus]|uniref:calcium-binding protein P-like n=1 Tax=Oreochromis aureus TaxID=47969 RepID=UPI0019541142|nr:calcium-binding protein P-like [Oreochromis aureus]